MAERKENIKSLFSNTRTRVIIILTTLVLVATVAVGFVKFGKSSDVLSAKNKIKSSPARLRSIPGSSDQTAQYAALQEIQNIEQAKKAGKSGSSAIPTIIRTQAFGEGVEMIGPQGGEGGIGFTTLAQADDIGPQQSLWTQTLKNEKCTPAVVKRVMAQGAMLNDLKSACSCTQLRDFGYSLKELTTVCTCVELKEAGFSAANMKAIDFDIEKLRRCGFSACEVRGADFTAKQMVLAGFTQGELKGAGFPLREIEQANALPEGISVDDVRKAGCLPEELAKLRKKGVSAAEIVRISGCDASALKAAGFSAKELKDAGFSAKELKDAGFSAAELKAAGFNAKELKDAGFSAAELKAAGFNAKDLKAAGFSAAELKAAGFSAKDLKDAGFSAAELKAAGFSAKDLKDAGFSAAELKAAGFNAKDLIKAGFLPAELKAVGFSPEEIIAAERSLVGLDAVRAAGCDPVKLKALRAAGVSVQQIREVSGCSADALKAAGFSAKELMDAGFSAKDLKDAGFSAAELKAAGFSAKDLKDAGFSAAELKAAGFSAKDLKDAGFSAAQLKAAGFSAKDLKAAGFSAAELKAAGFSAKDLKDAGFSAAELKAAGFSAKELKDAGFSAAELKAAGFSAKDLKEAGFSAAELKAAGFSAKDLKAAGFSADELKAAGFSAKDLKEAGFSSNEVKAAFPELQATQAIQDTMPSLPSFSKKSTAQSGARKGVTLNNSEQLKAIKSRQESQALDQKYQAKVKQRSGAMLGVAKQALKKWEEAPTQVYIGGNPQDEAKEEQGLVGGAEGSVGANLASDDALANAMKKGPSVIKMGDILFAVLDTSVNSDEPGPILATIVSGKLKGSKLIGSFNLPSNADKMVITFSTLSMLGADKTLSINAYAIDPDTARTALSSRTNHHYLMRYGALFASTFMSGFSSAIQSADTTVTVGGTGGTTETTVQNGIDRSALENALIGLGEVGKAWAQTAQQNMNRPTTVELFSGTGLGILFTQDVTLL